MADHDKTTIDAVTRRLLGRGLITIYDIPRPAGLGRISIKFESGGQVGVEDFTYSDVHGRLTALAMARREAARWAHEADVVDETL